MKLDEVLHMNGGTGETSYAVNSLLQRNAISMTKSIADEAITGLVRSSNYPPKGSLAIADLGCGSGPNTFLAVSELVKSFVGISKNLGKEPPKEFHILLNDLPGNDFNNIFSSLHQFKKQMMMMDESSTMFFNGVPGSFYGRLFPSESVHFVHSSYSLHWLSQVPDRLEENGGNVTINSRSPPSVFEAYYGQFRKDFSSFLRCRAPEMVKGGRMVLTLLGRRNEDIGGRECYYIWELISIVLNQMAQQGSISKERLKSFNVPLYMPSPTEVEVEVKEEGSFAIDKLQVTEVSWYQGDQVESGGYHVANCMRAVAEPLLTYHFGSDDCEFIDRVFQKYRGIVSERMAAGKTSCFNLTISLVKY